MDLSIIIVSFNTKEITFRCLSSLIESLDKKLNWEVIIVDNGSTDDTQTQIVKLKAQNDNLKLKTIFNTENLGFTKANNQGVKLSTGKYILFLNSDVIIDKVDFGELISYLDKNNDVGALTVKVNLQENGIDPASHRGFPTLWRSFCYFSGLEKITKGFGLGKRLFGGYHLLNNNFGGVHEIDSPSGAFFLTRRDVFNKLNGFDEKFFMYGEDLDLAYRLRQQDYKIIYYPTWSVTHLKYQSGLKKNNSRRKMIKKHFYEAMKIFYTKHYESRYPWLLNKIIYYLIDLKEKLS